MTPLVGKQEAADCNGSDEPGASFAKVADVTM